MVPCLASGPVWAEETGDDAEEKGKVYRKYHADGVVEFSDKPLKGGDELKVEEVPTYRFATPKKSPSTPKAVAPSPAKAPPLRTKKLKPASEYTALVITSPSRDQTIRANDGNINVSYSLSPELQHFKGHKLVYILDGRVLKQTGPGLKNLSRGTHTLVLQVVDKSNKILIHSDSVSFHIKRYFKPRSQKQTPTPQESPSGDEFET